MERLEQEAPLETGFPIRSGLGSGRFQFDACGSHDAVVAVLTHSQMALAERVGIHQPA